MFQADAESRTATAANCDYYYDMMYYVPFSTFMNPEHGNDPYKVLVAGTAYLNSFNVDVLEEYFFLPKILEEYLYADCLNFVVL